MFAGRWRPYCAAAACGSVARGSGFSGAARRGAAGLFLGVGFSGGAAQRGGRLSDQTALQARVYSSISALAADSPRRLLFGSGNASVLHAASYAFPQPPGSEEEVPGVLRAWDRSMLRDGEGTGTASIVTTTLADVVHARVARVGAGAVVEGRADGEAPAVRAQRDRSARLVLRRLGVDVARRGGSSNFRRPLHLG